MSYVKKASERIAELAEEVARLKAQNETLLADNKTLRDLLHGWYDWDAKEYRERMNDRDPKENNQ